MNKLCLVAVPLVLMALQAECSPYFKDPALQDELDRLIAEALDRDTSKQPSKNEYERYYKVRKFVEKHTQQQKKEDTEAPIRGPGAEQFLSKDWWFNRHPKVFGLTETEQPSARVQVQDKNGNYRQFPRLTYSDSE